MLYAEFIRESSRLVVDRLRIHWRTLVSAYQLINRIRLSASDAVLAMAEDVLP